MKRAATVIAETLGWDVSDMSEQRYQRYTAPAVYAIGNQYFAAYHTKPRHKDIGTDWVEHTDQFGARGTNMKVWVCNSIISQAA
jgi:hypothetical protein